MGWRQAPGVVELRVRLVDLDGRPIAGAHVQWTGIEGLAAFGPDSQRPVVGFAEAYTGADGWVHTYPFIVLQYWGLGGTNDHEFNLPLPRSREAWGPYWWGFDGGGLGGAVPPPGSTPAGPNPNAGWGDAWFLTAEGRPWGVTISPPGDDGGMFATFTRKPDWPLQPSQSYEWEVRVEVLSGGGEGAEGCPCGEVSLQSSSAKPFAALAVMQATLADRLGAGWADKLAFGGDDGEWFQTPSPLPTMHPGSAARSENVISGLSASLLAEVATFRKCLVTTDGAATAEQVKAVLDNQDKLGTALADVHQTLCRLVVNQRVSEVAIAQRFEMLFQMVALLGTCLYDEGWYDQVNIIRERSA